MKESIFIKTLGESPIIRVLDFLLDNRIFDYSLTEIAKGSEVSWATINKIFPELEKRSLVVMTRQISRAKMYKLNFENPVVKHLLEFDIAISKEFLEQEAERQKKTIKA